MTTPTPAGWYPDPTVAGQQRWWDGAQWSEHVAPGGPAGPTGAATAWQQRHAEQHLGGAQAQSGAPAGGRSPWTEDRLFVSQKRKLIELTNEYAVFGAGGEQVGAVVQTGQSGAKKALRFLTSLDQYLTHTVEVRDAAGATVVVMTRPAKVFKSTMIVARPDGTEIGRLVQRNVFGKIRFSMEAATAAGTVEIGSLNAENWRAWNFSIRDASDVEVARITKTWEGLATTLFSTADNYLVEIHGRPAEPLHSLVVAAALTVDTALKQDSRGFG